MSLSNTSKIEVSHFGFMWFSLVNMLFFAYQLLLTPRWKQVEVFMTVVMYGRLQNSRFWKFSRGAKHRKRDPRVWSARASHALQVCKMSLPILPRRFYIRFRPFVRILTIACICKKYDCFAVYHVSCTTARSVRTKNWYLTPGKTKPESEIVISMWEKLSS